MTPPLSCDKEPLENKFADGFWQIHQAGPLEGSVSSSLGARYISIMTFVVPLGHTVGQGGCTDVIGQLSLAACIYYKYPGLLFQYHKVFK